MFSLRTAAALGVLVMATALPAQHLSADGATQTFGFLTDQYFDEIYFHFAPTAGTQAGLHQYDAQLEDYSAAGVQKQVAALKAFEKKLTAIDAGSLDAEPAADYAILLNNVRSQLLYLEVIRGWEKDPSTYASGITNSVFVLMSRPYAPVNTRLRAAVARERLMPAVLADGKKNLKNPPRIYVEIALEQIDGLVSFFQNDVPTAFAEADDAKLKSEFTQSNAAVIAALKDFGAWMKSDLLPRSNGDFRYGADTYRRALALNEMVDIPLDRLLEIGLSDLHRNQQEFTRVAKEIDPTKTPEQIHQELLALHPSADKLMPAFHDTFNSLQQFIAVKHIITLPTQEQPVLEETPPFMRATTQASMDPPGPFETHSTKALFNVTLPEATWSQKQKDEYLEAFNVGTIVSTSVHEAFPGHFTQFLWQKQFPSKIRKLLGANTNVEGWAHYTEQMMLDEGYAEVVAKTPREAKLIKLGQLMDALLRDARFVCAIRMHTGVGGPMTVEQATDFFVTEGYQTRPIAEMEAKRGTSDALYLYYTLGKLQILKLRADVEKKQGATFSLQRFHDDLMRQGMAPIKIIRRSMLHDDSPVL